MFIRIGFFPYIALGFLFQYLEYGNASLGETNTWVHIIFWFWILLWWFVAWVTYWTVLIGVAVLLVVAGVHYWRTRTLPRFVTSWLLRLKIARNRRKSAATMRRATDVLRASRRDD